MNVKERRLAQVLHRYRDVGAGDIMTWYGHLVVVISRHPKGWTLQRCDTGKTFDLTFSIYTDLDALQNVFRFVRDDTLF